MIVFYDGDFLSNLERFGRFVLEILEQFGKLGVLQNFGTIWPNLGGL